jgi:alpha-glucosidase
MSIQQFKNGSFITEYETIKLHFHGLPFKIKTVEIDNEEVAATAIKLKNNSIEVSKDFTSLYISDK